MSNDKLTDGDLRALMEMALDEGSGACAMDGITLGRLVRELQDRRLADDVPHPMHRKRRCPACGRMTRVTTAGCDHCDLEDK